jgi:hypothetical protein
MSNPADTSPFALAHALTFSAKASVVARLLQGSGGVQALAGPLHKPLLLTGHTDTPHSERSAQKILLVLVLVLADESGDDGRSGPPQAVLESVVLGSSAAPSIYVGAGSF